MRIFVPAALALLTALGACGPREGLFADRSVSVGPAAQTGAAPRFVGRWAASPEACARPWVFEARRLQGEGVDCDLERVEASSAGYSAASVCRTGATAQPGRVLMVLPDGPPVTLTVSGGPFRDALPLQRCATQKR